MYTLCIKFSAFKYIYFKNMFFVCIYLFLSWRFKNVTVVIISICYYYSVNTLLLMKFSKYIYIYPRVIIFFIAKLTPYYV